MQDGLYRAQFATPIGAGFGVVVIDGTNFRGGDSAMAYVGTLEERGNQLVASIRTFRHSNVVGLGLSVLGADNVTFAVAGIAANDTSVRLAGTVPGTNLEFSVTLDRIAS